MNSKFKGFLSACVICVPIGCSGSLTDAQYVEKAQGYLDQGQLQAASIELKNALLQNQKNAQARWLLGKVDLDIGDAAAAEKELRHASELGVADGAVLPILAQALLAQGKYEELQALSLETLTTEDQKAVLLASQGLGKLAQGEIDAAGRKDRAGGIDGSPITVCGCSQSASARNETAKRSGSQ